MLCCGICYFRARMSTMHDIDIRLVEMTMDIMKYVIHRITETNPKTGHFRSEADLLAEVGETITPEGITGEKALSLWRNVLSKAAINIDHPRHLAFVPASPSKAAVMFDLVTSAASIHGAYWMEGAGGIFCENQAMKWIVSLTGLPAGSFGVFTSGGTAANLSAIVTAREFWRSQHPDRKYTRGLIVSSEGAHSSVKAMAKVIDADIFLIPIEEKLTGTVLLDALARLSAQDRARVFCIVATAGTTNAGIIDELDGIGTICRQQEIWFHVDAAYGGGALAADSVRHLFAGIEQADSITIDPHKWLFSPYDCGAVIYRNPELAHQAHAQEGSYLDVFKARGADGFNPSSYQIQLTRRLRGLPLWFSLAMHGTDRYKTAIERGIELARIAEKRINKNPLLEMVRPAALSCVLYRRIGWTEADYNAWMFRNLEAQYAFVAPTKWKGTNGMETVARFCFINPDTTEADIDGILATME